VTVTLSGCFSFTVAVTLAGFWAQLPQSHSQLYTATVTASVTHSKAVCACCMAGCNYQTPKWRSVDQLHTTRQHVHQFLVCVSEAVAAAGAQSPWHVCKMHGPILLHTQIASCSAATYILNPIVLVLCLRSCACCCCAADVPCTRCMVQFCYTHKSTNSFSTVRSCVSDTPKLLKTLTAVWWCSMHTL